MAVEPAASPLLPPAAAAAAAAFVPINIASATPRVASRRLSVPRVTPVDPAALLPHVTPLDLSPNHFKLLYLVSLYAVASNSIYQNERWVRHVPLLVLMFEGIVRGKLGFDYAPSSVRLSFKGRTLRRWINVSREGVAALSDLWDLRLVNGLKLSSDDFQPITAYQVAARGVALLVHLPQQLRNDVDSFAYPPTPLERTPLRVAYDNMRFHLRAGGYTKPSTITESEDVSYVSSPFLPRCLRACSRETNNLAMRSNRHRAHECATGSSSISSETTEAVTLSDVRALVGEWVPFGSNQIVALNERIGALDRCQGGILTSVVDRAPTHPRFRVPLGQTHVRILDLDFVRFINFEAESHFPETAGIVQVESFGMHLNCDGSLIYGIHVDAIMDRKFDDVSIDHLARLLVDVHQDSSLLVNDLLSRYQVSLLEMLYLGDSFHRNKYNCVLAGAIRPKLPAAAYVHNAVYANELAQVLGDVCASHDISPHDVLVVGRSGCLFAGPTIGKYESLCTAYVALVSRDVFLKNFFARTFVLDATLKDIRRLIHRVHAEPATALVVREKLAVVSKDTILLAETLEYLLDSLEDIAFTPNDRSSNDDVIDDVANDDAEAQLIEVLALHSLKAQTTMRCHDSIKLMENTMLQLEQLQMIAEATATKQLELACQRVHLNTHALMAGAALQERSRLTLQALQYLVAGLFAFDVIDRLSGGTWHVHLAPWVRTDVIDVLLARPFVWWALNMLAFAVVVAAVHAAERVIASRALGHATVRIEVNRRMSQRRLLRWLADRTVTHSAAMQSVRSSGTAATRFRVIAWTERMDTLDTPDDARAAAAPFRIEIVYDEKHSFLLFATLRFSARATRMCEDDAAAKLNELLTTHGVFKTDNDDDNESDVAAASSKRVRLDSDA